jgi:hypothetical protein
MLVTTKPVVLVTSHNVEKLSGVLNSFVGTVVFFRSRSLPPGPFVKGLTRLEHSEVDYVMELSDGPGLVEGKPYFDVSEYTVRELAGHVRRRTGAAINTWNGAPVRVNVELPSLTTQAKTLINSLTEWAKKGMKVVDPQTLEARLGVCRGCEFWNPNGFKGTGRCMKCGCSTQAKLRMATASCPVNKWAAVA